jgi:hypothetical protein
MARDFKHLGRLPGRKTVNQSGFPMQRSIPGCAGGFGHGFVARHADVAQKVVVEAGQAFARAGKTGKAGKDCGKTEQAQGGKRAGKAKRGHGGFL